MTSTGWAADKGVTGTLHSDPVTLGTLMADAGGKVDGSFAVPTSAPAGAHELVLSGTDTSGAPRIVRAAVQIAAATGTSPAQVASTSVATGADPDAILPVTGAALARTAWLGSTLLGCGAMFTIAALRRRRVEQCR